MSESKPLLAKIFEQCRLARNRGDVDAVRTLLQDMNPEGLGSKARRLYDYLQDYAIRVSIARQQPTLDALQRVYVSAQATGQHGWSSIESYVSGADYSGRHVTLLRPHADWGALSLDADDGLQDILAGSGSAVLLLCGFDWHSQPIHRDPKLRDALRAWSGLRVGIFQEHISAPWIRTDPKLSKVFDEAALSASECLTHIVCNHETDVAHLRRLGIRIPVTFLPFCADLSVFSRTTPYDKRDSRAFFRGKRLEFMGSSPYADRERIAQYLCSASEALIEDLQPVDQLDRRTMIKRYVADLNHHALQLNLPSVSDSLTCRPFEVMACGGLLLQSPPEGEISSLIFPSTLYVPFDRYDPESVLDAIRTYQADPKSAQAIAEAGWRHVTRRHDSKTRVRQMLGWVTGNLSESNLVRELTANDDKPERSVQVVVPRSIQSSLKKARIVLDLVFYQYARSGIAQVWNRLLRDWASMGFAKHFVLIQRAGAQHAPPADVMAAYQVVKIPAHGSKDDAARLQTVCDANAATLFLSTYYSMPLRTPALLMMHDCIPERINPDFETDPEWAEKRAAIDYAHAYLCISKTTANELQRFYPEATRGKRSYVSHNTIPDYFVPPPQSQVEAFRAKYGIRGAYLLFAGERFGYRGYKNVEAVCQALGNLVHYQPDLPEKFTILFLGGAEYGDRWTVEPELERYLSAWEIYRLSIDDDEMPAAFAGAALTIYPSLIEGFGLPPGESLLCGTPVLAWNSPINDEVYGDLVETLDPEAPGGLVQQIGACLHNLSTLREKASKAAVMLRKRASARGGSTQSGTFLELVLLHAQRPLDWGDEGVEPLLFDAFPSERADWLQRLIDGHPDEVTGYGLRFGTEPLRSAAIVSIYNGPDFIKGCLDDLIDQTELVNGRMEVLLIDSASPGGERAQILPIVRSTPGLRYLRTVERESLYRAWNRGARGSRARYISNSNLDDRHRRDFFERLSDVLDVESDVQLVYPAQYLSSIPNEHFADHVPVRSWGWPEYTLEQLRIGNHVGSQPMWRRSVHQKIGYFEERYRISGDYDFWCRIAHHVGPLKLYPAHIGLYYFNGSGIEHGDPLRSEEEVAEICERFDIRKNYVTSQADRERADGSGESPRQIEDLQYSGIVLGGQVNVIIPFQGGVRSALSLVDAALGQTVSVSHRIQILLVAHGWSYDQIRAFNDQNLQPLAKQIRMSPRPSLDCGFEPDACTIVLTQDPCNRYAFESTMASLYADPTRDFMPLEVDGKRCGAVRKQFSGIESEFAL